MQLGGHRAGGGAAVGARVLIVGRELGARAAFLRQVEQRVVAEAVGAARGGADDARERAACGEFDETTIFDLNFHGTFIAGLISSNGLGMASVAPNAQHMAVKVLNCSGSGSFGDIIAGIAYATDAGADVINMSLGAHFSAAAEGAWPLIMALQRAVMYANAQGVLVVAASGNDGLNLDDDGDYIHVPSQLPNVMSVGATAPIAQEGYDMLASYSNHGTTGVEMVAPGGDLTAEGVCGFAPDYRCDLVLSAFTSFIAPGTSWYVLASGTSFAAPMVAAGASVLISDGGIGKPESMWPQPVALRACLRQGAEPVGPEYLYGVGRLDMLGSQQCQRFSAHR